MTEPMRLYDIRRLDTELDALAGPGHPASVLEPGVVSANNVAVAGQDGFLFIANGANRWERQFLGELRLSPVWIPNWRRRFAARQAEAAARGVPLWNLIAPEKQVVYSDKRWGPEAPTGDQRPLMLLMAELEPEARLVYPAAELRAARALAPTYFRHNSHWTASGCLAATAALLKSMGVAADFDDLSFAVQRMRSRHDLSVHFLDPPPAEDFILLAPAGQVTDANRNLERTGRNTGETYTVHNPDAPDGRTLVLFGDSYACDAGLAAALSAVFATVVFLWSKPVLWDVVAERRADLVVWESAERFLGEVPES